MEQQIILQLLERVKDLRENQSALETLLQNQEQQIHDLSNTIQHLLSHEELKPADRRKP